MFLLKSVIEKGSLDTIKYLVSKGADINAKDSDGKAPLHWAIKEENLDIIECLISNGADVNAKDKYDKTPLHWAIGEVSLDITKHKDSYFAISADQAVARMGKLYIIDYLILNGADVNAKNDDGEIPLDLAIRKEYLDVVEYLLHYMPIPLSTGRQK